LTASQRLRVLVLARAYPSEALPGQGLWAARLVNAMLPFADPTVVSAIPWTPAAVPVDEWLRLRRVPRHATYENVEVLHPRVPGGVVHATHAIDARLALPSLRRLASRLHAQQRFDIIHAHIIYPEGVIAANIGRHLGVPVVTTEHANWRPWLDTERRVRSQVLRALPDIRIVTAVSQATRQTLYDVAGESLKVELLPNVVDEDAFPAAGLEPRIPGRILFVGVVRHVKGLDVLVRALDHIRTAIPEAHLRVIGSTLSPVQRREVERVRTLVASLGLDRQVTFVNHLNATAVSREMRQAVVVAVPSRRESFSAVTIEALASGTPVVATRCGGPEELLDDEVGRLVAVEDPIAMAAALAEVLRSPGLFDPQTLRSRVLPRFGLAASTQRLRDLYRMALSDER